MNNEIEILARNGEVVLDTSGIERYGEKSIRYYFYPKGNKKIPTERLRNDAQDLEEILGLERLNVIAEVHTEIEEFLKVLEREVEYSPEERSIRLERLNLYKRRILNFINRLKNKDPRVNFTDEQADKVVKYYEMASSFSFLLEPENGLPRISKKFGEDLETDIHIISTAFTLAHESPVMIITKNLGIRDLSQMMGLLLHYPIVREIYEVIEPPSHQIRTGSTTIDFPDVSYIPQPKKLISS